MMPIYVFENTETKEIKEVFLPINSDKKYYGDSGTEKDWVRVYLPPNISLDTKIDPYSSSDFVKKTAQKKGTIGDLIDKSKELSEARGGSNSDPVLKKYFSDYVSKNGVKHTAQIKSEKKEKAKEKIKKMGIIAD